MMRLSTMAKIDSFIRDDGSSPVAEQILARWVYDRGSVQFFRSSANFVYRFRDQDRSCFLRFADASERSRDAIEAEITILDVVAKAGIVAAAPVVSKQGNAVETVDTDWGTFHAVVFSALAGKHYELAELTDADFRQWGAALGGLHSAMSAFAAIPGRMAWPEHVAFVRQYLPDDSPGLHAEFTELIATISALPMSQETYGLTHGDFELDNLVWQGASTRIGILDFDDCSHLWYAADIAFALRDLFEAGADSGDTRFRAFVEGYRENHSLNDESIAYLPLFVRYTRLFNYARIARATDLDFKAEYPEWLLRLNGKLLDRMTAYRASVEAQHASG